MQELYQIVCTEIKEAVLVSLQIRSTGISTTPLHTV